MDSMALESVEELVELLQDPGAMRRAVEKKLMRALWRLARQAILQALPEESPWKAGLRHLAGVSY